MGNPTRYHVCPLCGFEFVKQDTLCSHGCPLGPSCSQVRCPGCGYEFPDRPRFLSWLKKVFRRDEPSCGANARKQELLTLDRMPEGGVCLVVALGASKPSRRNALAVFGLVPGSEVVLQQKSPACVVRIGETDLALDPEIASEIVVRPRDSTAAG